MYITIHVHNIFYRSISTPITNGDLSPAKTETTQSPISPTITPVINSPLNTITQDQSSKTTTTPEEERTEAQTIQNNPEDINICINKTQNNENKEEKQDIVQDIQSSESGETGLKIDENSVEKSGKDSGQSHVENGEKIADTPEEIVAKGEMPTG
jgi:TolA-binding protein